MHLLADVIYASRVGKHDLAVTKLAKVLCAGIDDFSKSFFDVSLMLGVLRHIPDYCSVCCTRASK